MKVAVVYPEVYDLARFREKRKEYPPFGIMYLASVMEGEGHHIQILKVSSDQTNLDLRDFDAIAFSIPSSATYGLIKESRLQSVYSGDPLIMVGGVHPNFYPEDTLLDIKPHVVGVGECEETILELLQQVNTRQFSGILGVCYLDGLESKRTPPRPITSSLDSLPLPW